MSNVHAAYLLLTIIIIVDTIKYEIDASEIDRKIEGPSPTGFSTEFQWNFINFTWDDSYTNAIADRRYIPENNAMAGIKFYQNKMYIAMPRIRDGTSATLGYISTENATKMNPLVTPFPNWQMNAMDENCDNLKSVQSMEIDRNGTMWVLDGFRLKNNSQCPPKLVLFDLNNENSVVLQYSFPNWVCLTYGGFLNDIVVDDSNGTFAYITDNSPIDPGLIIFSRMKKRAWKIRDASMFPDISSSNYVVGGHEFSALAPIDGITLSPKQSNGPRLVFYCSLSGLNLYSISTEILQNEKACEGGDWRRSVNNVGKKQAPSDGLMMDNQGDLYYGLLPLHAVGKWNFKELFSTAKIIDQNNETMTWTDSFSFDDKGNLYLLVNNIHKFFDIRYKLEISDEVKFRILKMNTSTKSYLYS